MALFALIPTAYAYNYINIDPSFATSTLAVSGGLFSDFSVIIYLILGVLLFGTLVAFLIGVFRHH